jgi:uncharacterized protein YfkK (UPF0435 family)
MGIIPASEWRKMDSLEILESIGIAIKVLEDRMENDIIEDEEFELILDNATKMLTILNNYIKPEEKLVETFIEDLHQITTLIQEYSEGKRKLTDIYNFIDTRIEAYQE